MPIQVRCPQGHTLVAPEKYAGRRVKCPKCQAPCEIPATSGVPREVAPIAVAAKPAASEGRSTKPPPLPSSPPKGSVAVPPPAPTVVVLPPPVLAPSAPLSHATAMPVTPRVVQHSLGVQGYRAEPIHVHTVYWLAGGVITLVLFQLAPAVNHLNPATAPNWVRWLMMFALVQVAFAVWMTSLPDWCTVRVTMYVLAGIATCYGVALGVSVVTPPSGSLPFDLDDVRDKVRLWCAATLLLVCLMTYVVGRVGFRWRKSYLNRGLTSM